jgi:hypothetical protein
MILPEPTHNENKLVSAMPQVASYATHKHIGPNITMHTESTTHRRLYKIYYQMKIDKHSNQRESITIIIRKLKRKGKKTIK